MIGRPTRYVETTDYTVINFPTKNMQNDATLHLNGVEQRYFQQLKSR